MKATTIRRSAMHAFAAALLSLAAASCNTIPEEGALGPGRSGNPAEGPAGSETLELTIAGAPSTKVSIRSGSGKFSWSVGDKVAVWYNNGGTGNFVSGEVKAHEKFTDTHSATVSGAGTRGLLAFYPDDVCTDLTNMRGSSDYAKITYKGIYSMVGKSEEYVPMPMAAFNDAFKSGLHFYHAGGLLRFKMYAVPAGTTWIKISSDGGSPLSGDVLVKKTPLDVTRTDPFFPSAQYAGAVASDLWSQCTATQKQTAWVRISDSGLSEETDGVVINLPVPQGSYSVITLDAYSGDGEPAADLSDGNSLTRITTDYNSGGKQIRQVLNWDCERAQGHELAVCFGYREPSDPIVGATSAQHKFSVGPNKKIYIARSNLAYFGESFPDSPWRLMREPWEIPDVNGGRTKNSDIFTFQYGTSGYVPANATIDVKDKYMPWCKVDADDNFGPSIDEMVETFSGSHTITMNYADAPIRGINREFNAKEDISILNFAPQWDWGLYNGRRGSNPYNPNATGLYTYDGREMTGDWRTLTFEEMLYLFAHRSPTIPESSPQLPLSRYYYEDGNSGDRGYYAHSTNYYDRGWVFNHNNGQWEARPVVGTGSSHKREINYNGQDVPRYTYIQVEDDEGNITWCLALLCDDWDPDTDDPCRNSANLSGGKRLVLGNASSGVNIYSEAAVKFFLEPSGIRLFGVDHDNYYVDNYWASTRSYYSLDAVESYNEYDDEIANYLEFNNGYYYLKSNAPRSQSDEVDEVSVVRYMSLNYGPNHYLFTSFSGGYPTKSTRAYVMLVQEVNGN